MKGNVFDIKKFAIHDGPGIRTTLFLKGCPLKCMWCHNPEGIDLKMRLWYFEQKCIQCGSCLSACTQGALSQGSENEPFISINHQKCNSCGDCAKVCPTNALCFDGYELEAADAVEKLLQDKIFYDQSGGGITISGGDPLFQSDFSKAVLFECRKAGVHTAIETSMYSKEDVFESFFGLVNLFIVDIKLFDEIQHKKYTGTGNKLIFSNFKKLVESKQNILVRIPLIPKITATESNLKSIARFVFETSSEVEIELINFNPLSENKYRIMGKEYDFLTKMKPFTGNQLDDFYSILKAQGVKTIRETTIS